MLLFWIIFGVRTVERELSGGDFHCLECACTQTYARREVRRYFHIFLIPVFPLGKLDEHLECCACHSYYKPSELAQLAPAHGDPDDANSYAQ